MSRRVAVLFARRDSVYKSIPDCDVYDADRNALTWAGGSPIVAHPPCRAWGSLRQFAKPSPGEMDLAVFAVEQVRKNGGVLEHPIRSLLWPTMNLPRPGLVDEFGGWTLPVLQFWFGHKADKATYLYIVGCRPDRLPSMPFKFGYASHVVATGKKGMRRPEISKAEREHTPRLLAEWLIELARRSSPAFLLGSLPICAGAGFHPLPSRDFIPHGEPYKTADSRKRTRPCGLRI